MPLDLMGTKFKYMTDNAIESAKAVINCERCSSDAPTYMIEAILDHDVNDDIDDVDPIDLDEGRALCLSCIRAIPLRCLRPRQSELHVQAVVNHHFPKGTLSGEERFNRAVEICDEMRRTPKVFMFLQCQDWPTCCGEFTEYVGREPANGNDFTDYECWDEADSFIANFSLSDFYPLDKIEVLSSMSLFHCIHCDHKFWVFQYSGLFWAGPTKHDA